MAQLGVKCLGKGHDPLIIPYKVWTYNFSITRQDLKPQGNESLLLKQLSSKFIQQQTLQLLPIVTI